MAAPHTPAAPASGSATSGNPTGAAAAAAGGASPGSDAQMAPGLTLSPGLEQLSEAQIMAAFMGSPVEVKGGKGGKEATNPEEADEAEEDEETEAEDESAEVEEEEESEADDETDPETEAEEENEAEDEDEETDTEDEAKDDPFKGKAGLKKRFQKLLKENPKLKRENQALTEKLEAMSRQPEVVLGSDRGNPLAQARTEAEVETLAGQLHSDAKSKLRWLNRHPEGGVWQEGTEHAVTMDEKAVENAIDFYENQLQSLEKHKSDRKDWLAKYGETAKALGADKVTELIKPKVATRESSLFKQVPELMRHAEFLQVLADAQAGRDLREKQAQGIKFVEVKGSKGKPKGEAGKEGSSQREATAARTPMPKGPEKKVPERKPEVMTAEKMNKLRAEAAAGNRAAQAKLMELFTS